VHAHLRYAQARAHVCEAESRLPAIAVPVQPIGLSEILLQRVATIGTCYYSSSTPAFAYRYQATPNTMRVGRGHDRSSTAAGSSIRCGSCHPVPARRAPSFCRCGLEADCSLLISPVASGRLDGFARCASTLLRHDLETSIAWRARSAAVSRTAARWPGTRLRPGT